MNRSSGGSNISECQKGEGEDGNGPQKGVACSSPKLGEHGVGEDVEQKGCDFYLHRSVSPHAMDEDHMAWNGHQ